MNENRRRENRQTHPRTDPERGSMSRSRPMAGRRGRCFRAWFCRGQAAGHDARSVGFGGRVRMRPQAPGSRRSRFFISGNGFFLQVCSPQTDSKADRTFCQERMSGGPRWGVKDIRRLWPDTNMLKPAGMSGWAAAPLNRRCRLKRMINDRRQPQRPSTASGLPVRRGGFEP